MVSSCTFCWASTIFSDAPPESMPQKDLCHYSFEWLEYDEVNLDLLQDDWDIDDSVEWLCCSPSTYASNSAPSGFGESVFSKTSVFGTSFSNYNW